MMAGGRDAGGLPSETCEDVHCTKPSAEPQESINFMIFDMILKPTSS